MVGFWLLRGRDRSFYDHVGAAGGDHGVLAMVAGPRCFLRADQSGARTCYDGGVFPCRVIRSVSEKSLVGHVDVGVEEHRSLWSKPPGSFDVAHTDRFRYFVSCSRAGLSRPRAGRPLCCSFSQFCPRTTRRVHQIRGRGGGDTASVWTLGAASTRQGTL